MSVWRGIIFGRVEQIYFGKGGVCRVKVRTDRGNLVAFNANDCDHEVR